MKKLYYGYDLFKKDTQELVNKCRIFEPEILLAVARGGLTLSHLIAQALNIRDLYTLNSIHYDGEKKLDTFNIFNIPDLSWANRVLIIDDIIDSGETMKEILSILKEKFPNIEFKIASLFYKTTALIKPDFSVREANEWIDFFWEVDVK
ncbi:MAG: phosphoribosyltransferase family protein [Aliarcobacter sp.]|nr:phosphoribosyltransferase family protein [Aliarcobacter sp.]